ncbi:MAG: 7-cyano-7-deazaguanine synthase, partial [Terriglobales bacterium]
IQIITPLIAMRKFEIVRLGLELGAPFDLTWSCYTNEDRACGVCDSCVLRLRAFREAGRADPIPYAGVIDGM